MLFCKSPFVHTLARAKKIKWPVMLVPSLPHLPLLLPYLQRYLRTVGVEKKEIQDNYSNLVEEKITFLRKNLDYQKAHDLWAS